MSSSCWDGENNTIYNLSSNHCFAYRGGVGCISLWLWCWDLMTVHQRWTDEEPLGFETVCQKLSWVSHLKWIYVHSLQCGHRRMKIHSFTFQYFPSTPLSPPLSLSPHSMMLEVLRARNPISQPLNRQQFHPANSIVKIVQWGFLNRLRPQL